MVRFNFILSAAIGFMTALMLTTCASPSRVVWEYYDQCARENPSFLAMAECGRQKRLAECVPNNTCSPEGTMFMQYIDTLVLSVKKKELTEAEAMRRYTEYKNGGTPSHPWGQSHGGSAIDIRAVPTLFLDHAEHAKRCRMTSVRHLICLFYA